jgi:hypothetical protein
MMQFFVLLQESVTNYFDVVYQRIFSPVKYATNYFDVVYQEFSYQSSKAYTY